MDHSSLSLSTDIASKSLTKLGVHVNAVPTNGLDGRDVGMQCPSVWFIAMLVDVGEGGIQSVIDSMCSSSIERGSIHTGRAGITANNDIQFCGKDRSDSLIFCRLALENLTNFGGIDVAKMCVFKMALIVHNCQMIK